MTPRLIQGDDPLAADELTAEQLSVYFRIIEEPAAWHPRPLTQPLTLALRRLETLRYLAGLPSQVRRYEA